MKEIKLVFHPPRIVQNYILGLSKFFFYLGCFTLGRIQWDAGVHIEMDWESKHPSAW